MHDSVVLNKDNNYNKCHTDMTDIVLICLIEQKFVCTPHYGSEIDDFLNRIASA